ncbi:MAG: sugar transporter [Bacteroidetes bacterium]|nr:MAG: sugar transporter [Bacteroidota bacterium]
MIRLLLLDLRLLLLVCAFFSFSVLRSQSLISPDKIKNIKVQSLTEAEVNKIKDEMKRQSISMEELEAMAISNGMPPGDFSILKSRLENKSADFSETNVEIGTKISEKPIEVDKRSGISAKKFNEQIFGSEIFSNPNLSFDPNLNLAPPPNYVLGPGDAMSVVVFGLQEYATSCTVDREGRIRLPSVGQLKVGGLTFSAAKSLIKKSLQRIFKTLGGQSDISINITSVRTINVTIIGSRKPGNYPISSLTTLFGALHKAGGPDDNGSYRAIEILRDNKVIKTVDLYAYLTKGDQSGNINLLDNDLIRIPLYQRRVKIVGKVKRSGLYELLEGETFDDLLFYCGGFDEAAYKANIKLTQNTEKELRISDLREEDYKNYKPKNGDLFRVGIILDRFENRVSVKGAVFRPDSYELVEGMTIKDLIDGADGLQEDAYRSSAQLFRLREDLTKEIITIDIRKVFSGDANHNLTLQREDELVISSVFDFKEDFTVSIGGEIRRPGRYTFVENISLFDLMLQAGGLTEAASSIVEISRIVKKDSVVFDNIETSQIITIRLNDGVRDLSQNIPLMPYDVIQIRKMPIYERLNVVTVRGAAFYPGKYVLANKKEKVLDVIIRSGGLTADANPEGLKIIRRTDRVGTETVEKIELSIPIEYKKILRNPNSKKNITLQYGDEIIIPKINETVKVFGNVRLNSEIPYKQGRRLRYYVRSVGGYGDLANKRRVYVVYSNGIAKTTRNFVLFKVHPRIKLGSEIVVPKKDLEIKQGFSTAELVGMTGVVGSLTGMTVSIISLFTK